MVKSKGTTDNEDETYYTDNRKPRNQRTSMNMNSIIISLLGSLSILLQDCSTNNTIISLLSCLSIPFTCPFSYPIKNIPKNVYFSFIFSLSPAKV